MSIKSGAIGTLAIGVAAIGAGGVLPVALNTAYEIDSAGIITNGTVAAALNTASETDSAGIIKPIKIVQLGTAYELDSGGEIAPVKVVPLGTAVEIDSASPFGIPVFAVLGTAYEIDTAGAIDAPALVHIQVPSILVNPAPAVLLFHDWSAAIPEGAEIRYVCDITGTPLLRVPISSWQATLKTDLANYVQIVIPAAAAYASEIQARAAEEFIISRRAILNGAAIEQEMARAPLSDIRLDQGHTNYSCTLSGYSTGFTAPGSPQPATDRTLLDIRTISIAAGRKRVRCGIDWFLRPGQRAIAGGETFTVGYINYYVNGQDAYMEVGEAA